VPEPKSAGSAFRDEGAILVVDDDESSREMLARRLRRCGYTVSAVPSGVHALALARSQKFDLVLLDMIMPDWTVSRSWPNSRPTPRCEKRPS